MFVSILSDIASRILLDLRDAVKQSFRVEIQAVEGVDFVDEGELAWERGLRSSLNELLANVAGGVLKDEESK